MEGAFDSSIWKQQSERCLGCGACAFVCPTCACFDIQEDAREVLVAGFVAGILVDSLYLHNILPVIIPDLLKALVGDNVFFISFRTCLIALMRPDVPDVDVVPVLVR